MARLQLLNDCSFEFMIWIVVTLINVKSCVYISTNLQSLTGWDQRDIRVVPANVGRFPEALVGAVLHGKGHGVTVTHGRPLQPGGGRERQREGERERQRVMDSLQGSNPKLRKEEERMVGDR